MIHKDELCELCNAAVSPPTLQESKAYFVSYIVVL